MTIQSILMKYEPKPENLLRAIKDVQKEYGFVDRMLIEQLARYFSLKPAAVFSAASFYDHINVKGKSSIVIRVCDGANCSTKGSSKVLEEVERFLGQKAGDDFNSNVKIEKESCFGFCAQGPIMVVNDVMYEKVTPEKVDEILSGYIDFQ